MLPMLSHARIETVFWGCVNFYCMSLSALHSVGIDVLLIVRPRSVRSLCLPVCLSVALWYNFNKNRLWSIDHAVFTKHFRFWQCIVAAISCYISETVQAGNKVTIECEYEIICGLLNGAISYDCITANPYGTFTRWISQKLCMETKLV